MDNVIIRERVFFLLVLLFCLAVLWPLRLPFALGVVFAFVSEEPVIWLQRKFRKTSKKSHWIISSLTIAAILGAFLIPIIFASYVAIGQLVNLLVAKQGAVSMPQISGVWAKWLSEKVSDFGVNVSIPQILSKVNDALVNLSQNALETLGAIVQGTPEILFDTFVMVMTWVVFTVQGPHFRAALLPKLIPWNEERRVICDTTADVLKGVIVANMLVSVVQSIIVSVILALFGIPRAFLWGVMAFFASFVPLVGTAPIMIGSAIYCFTQDRIPATIMLLISAVGVGSIDNILRPYFMQGSSHLSFFWIFIAFIGGIARFGVAGAVLGPLAFSLFVAIMKTLDLRYPLHVLLPKVSQSEEKEIRS
jgi:predicted PurR-regulated permease PerM